ncbi:MAG: hypothetical protein V3U76_06270 [Granulosicoccus sp.]
MAGGITEFHYKLPGIPGGNRPGAHRSQSLGAGLAFATHVRLFDQPDPRRLDLRASLRDTRREWLVRANRQRSSVTLQAIVDVSASMHFGSVCNKLAVVADFIEALGYSAFRHGDAVSLMAFDHQLRDDLYIPVRSGRGVGQDMSAVLRACVTEKDRAGVGGATISRISANFRSRGRAANDDDHDKIISALTACAERAASHRGLVFLVSDFHWPLERLTAVLDRLAHAFVVPIVVWDPAETEPPARGHWLSVRDAESGVQRNLWLRDTTRASWRSNVKRRRDQIESLFSARGLYPFYIEGHFDAEQLSQYFFEKTL